MRRWLTDWRTRRRAAKAANLDQLRPPSRWLRFAGIGVIFAAAVAVCGFLDLRGFNYFEQYAYNLRQSVFAARHTDRAEQARKQVVLVTLSDESFADGKLPPWPMPRSYHAKVIRDLTRAGARVIAVDLLFDLDSPQDGDLAAAAQSSGRVMWGSSFENENTPQQKICPPNRRLRQASPHWGHLLVPQDSERPVDRIKAVILHGGLPIPAFSLKAALMALEQENQPLRRVTGGWQIGDITIPADADGYFYVSR